MPPNYRAGYGLAFKGLQNNLLRLTEHLKLTCYFRELPYTNCVFLENGKLVENININIMERTFKCLQLENILQSNEHSKFTKISQDV